MDVVDKPNLEQYFDAVRKPFKAFLYAQELASGLLLAGLLAALVMVNGGWGSTYSAIQEFTIALQLGGWHVEGSLLGWINDGLIAVFFFLIGLEIKREFMAGELAERERRYLLFAAALGGMLVPAAFYASANLLMPDGVLKGWGIPMATDTALAIGLLALLRKRIPAALSAFLVGLAIVDDIGAVLVIAVFYTENLAFSGIGAGLVVIALLLLASRAGVRHPVFYIFGVLLLWFFIHHAGVHASIAGVIGALAVPARPRQDTSSFTERLGNLLERIRERRGNSDVLADEDEHADVRSVEAEARHATTPLRRWEDSLELPVGLLILPAFAFLNGGIQIDTDGLGSLWSQSVPLGIIGGLVVGKPIGIFFGSYLAVRFAGASLSDGVRWRHIVGIGMVAGIGFTMSTFIGNLAFGDVEADMDIVKLAILVGSAVAGLLGFILLWWTPEKEVEPSSDQ